MISELTEITEPAEVVAFRGWIFYDGECGFCRNLARRFEQTFNRRGFHFAIFPAGPRPSGMRVHTTDSRDFGGADAIVFLSGFVWWGIPIFLLAKFPGARAFFYRLYCAIAARRSCDNGSCQLRRNQ
jgi:hypothetical protein